MPVFKWLILSTECCDDRILLSPLCNTEHPEIQTGLLISVIQFCSVTQGNDVSANVFSFSPTTSVINQSGSSSDPAKAAVISHCLKT